MISAGQEIHFFWTMAIAGVVGRGAKFRISLLRLARRESFDATIDSISASRCDLLGTGTTRAESVMKQCGERWQAAKAAGTTNGATWSTGVASAQEAQYRSPGSTVVWADAHSHIYYFPGTRDYGHTKNSVYMCESET